MALSSGLGGGEEDSTISGINVTPLVDVMLVLLVIFMATTTSLVEQQFRVSLPSAHTGEASVPSPQMQNRLVLSLSPGGDLFVDNTPLSFAQLSGEIRGRKETAAQEQKPLMVELHADEKTPHGVVVKLMDALRQENILDFGIQVRPRDP